MEQSLILSGIYFLRIYLAYGVFVQTVT